jgi:hypothetical protein
MQLYYSVKFFWPLYTDRKDAFEVGEKKKSHEMCQEFIITTLPPPRRSPALPSFHDVLTCFVLS